MKIVFMGTSEFAVPILEGLVKEYEIVLVVTQPDRPFGRKKTLKPSPVKEVALLHNIPVFQPERIKEDFQPILAYGADLFVIAAYGQMIPESVLYYPKYKSINAHGSLLPKYRGGAPMQRAIMNGDEKTGVTIIYMTKKMDAGAMLAKKEVAITMEDDLGSLERKLGLAAQKLMLETIPCLASGNIVPTEQDLSEVTFAGILRPEEEKLDFGRKSKEIFDHVRAFRPKPLCHATIDGKKIKIIEVKIANDIKVEGVPGEIVMSGGNEVFVKTLDGAVSLEKVQAEGKNPLDIVSFMNGTGRNLFQKGRIFE